MRFETFMGWLFSCVLRVWHHAKLPALVGMLWAVQAFPQAVNPPQATAYWHDPIWNPLTEPIDWIEKYIDQTTQKQTAFEVTKIDFNSGSSDVFFPTFSQSILFKFEGYITSPKTASITFSGEANAGIILLIQDQLVISDWPDSDSWLGPKTYSKNSTGKVTFTENVKKPFTLYCYYNDINAFCRLSWDADGPAGVYNVVPVSAFLGERPTGISLSSTSISENSTPKATVGTLSATDGDMGQTHSFTLVSGTGDSDNASFVLNGLNGNTLVLKESANFEAKSTYSVRIRATDNLGLTSEKEFLITVGDVNEAPTDLSLSAMSIAENNALNATVGILAVIDPDAGATHTLTLVTGTGDSDNASFNLSGNSLRLTGSANFEAKSSYSVRIRATDAGGLWFEKALVITVTDVNEAPIVGISQGSTAAEEQVAVAVDGALTIVDGDSATLASATVSLSDGFLSSEDTLAYVNPGNGTHGNITSSYASSTGVLTLTSAGATATLEQWQSALRTVTYRNTSDTPNTANRKVTFVVNDGALDSAMVFKTLTVTPVNDAPVLLADGSSSDKAAGSAGAIKAATGTSANGVYWIQVNGVPTQVYCIMDGAIDGGGWMLAMKGANTGNTFAYASTHWTTSTTLNPSYLRGNSATVNEDAKFSVFNDSPADKVMAIFPTVPSNLRGGAVAGQSYGFLWIENMPTPANTANYTGRPVQGNYSGKTLKDLFAGGEKIFIRDATQSTPYRAAGVGVFSTQTDVRFFGFNYKNANGGNGWNKARFGFGWNENGGGLYPSGNEESNDVSGGIGIDRADWSAGDVIGCCHNSAGLNRQLAFELYIKAPSNASALAGNLTPIIEDALVSDIPGDPVSSFANGFSDPDSTAILGVAVTGVDESNGLWFYSIDGGSTWAGLSGASVTSARLLRADVADHRVRFVPNPNFNGTATLTFHAWDRSSGSAGGLADVSVNGGSTAYSSGTAVAVATVTAVNDAPALANVPVNGTEDTTINFSSAVFTTAFSDPEGTALASVSVLSLPLKGSLKLSGNPVTEGQAIAAANLGNLTYVPALNDNGSVTFTVSASDGSLSSPAATVTISLAAVNDPPVPSAPSGVTVLDTGADDVYTALPGTFSATDVDGDPIVYGLAQPAGGSIDFGDNSNSANYLTVPASTDFSFGTGDFTIETWAYVTQSTSFAFYDGGINVNGGGSFAFWRESYDLKIRIGGGNDLATRFDSQWLNRWMHYAVVRRDGVVTIYVGGVAVVSGTRAQNITQNAPVIGRLASYNGFGFSGRLSDYRVTKGSALYTSTFTPPTLRLQPVDGTGLLLSADSSQTYFEDASSAHRTLAKTGSVTFNQDSPGVKKTILPGADGLVSLAGSYGTLTMNPSTGLFSYLPVSSALNAMVAGSTDSDRFTLTASDGKATVATTLAVAVSGSSESPVVQTSQGPAQAVEQVAVAVDPALSVADVDSATFASATVTVSGGFQSGADVLAYANLPTHGNIAGSYNATSGVLTLTSAGATATVAQWQEALRSVTYLNVSDNPDVQDRTVTVVVNDGSVASMAASKLISVTAANDAPVATAQSVTTLEDTAKVITLTGTDAEGSSLTYSVLTQPTQGILSGTPPNLTYTPKANVHGSDSFTFKVNDGSLDSQTATVSITVTPVNDTPVLGSVGAAAGTSFFTDFSTLHPKATLVGTAKLQNGELVLTEAVNGQYGYMTIEPFSPSPSAFVAEFQYRAYDGNGADGVSFNYGVLSRSAVGAEYGTYTPEAGIISPESGSTSDTGLVVSFIEWGGQRVVVRAYNQTLATISFTLMSPDYRKVRISVDDAGKLSVSIGGQSVVSQVDLGQVYRQANKAAWQFGFGARTGGSNNRHSLNDLYIGSGGVVPDTFTFTEDAPGSIVFPGNPFADVDSTSLTVTLEVPGGTLTGAESAGVVVGGSAQARTFSGTVAALNAYFAVSGNITYQGALNASGNITLTIRLLDEQSTTSTTSVLSIAQVNDAPFLAAISVDGTEDTTVSFTVSNFTSAYSDVEQTALASVTVVSLPATGTLKLSGNGVTAGQVITAQNLANLTYVPAADENGAKTFTVSASDGSLSSPEATVTINLAAANDAPTLALGISTLHQFLQSGGFTPNQSGTVELLLVGGGGGGGSGLGGGGGGGGVVYMPSVPVVAGTTYPILVGQGGSAGFDGSPTMAFGATAAGGGSSGSHDRGEGRPGGSGGGAAAPNGNLNQGGLSSGSSLGANSGIIYGNRGGSITKPRAGGPTRAAGGGGAGSPGKDTDPNLTGDTGPTGDGSGGFGVLNSILGRDLYWGGGGGGSAYASQKGGYGGRGGGGGGGGHSGSGPGGLDGLSAGGDANGLHGGSGGANTGGGGGGGAWDGGLGGSGGSGIAILRYRAGGITLLDTGATDTISPMGGQLVGSDPDPESVLSYGIVGGATSGQKVIKKGTLGTLEVDSVTGSYVYSPDSAAINALRADETIIDAFQVTVSDSIVSNPTAAEFRVELVGANDAPALAPISVNGTEDTIVSFTVSNFTSAYSDVETPDLVSITVVALPATGTLKLSDAAVTAGQVIPVASLANLTYVPAANENGAKTFTVSASDGSTSSPDATVTINLAAVNDAPKLTLGITAEGGTKTVAGEYTIHTFTGPSATFTPSSSGVVEVLVVGGGGGGGGSYVGGGGGGGGVVSSATYAVNAGEPISVLVGNGGLGGIFGTRGANGGDSRFGSLVAAGGGGGGSFGANTGLAGGSGGGAGWQGLAAAGVAGQGSNGGDMGTSPANHGGGGGGAGGTPDNSGVGGPGVATSISGSTIYFAGGGAAGTDHSVSLAGGIGGGGAGGDGSSSNRNGRGGEANTGGGGGGGGGHSTSPVGGDGGSGIVIVRYRSNSISYVDTVASDSFSSATGTLTGTDPEGDATLTYGISGVTPVNGVATAKGTYGTLVVIASTGAFTYTPNPVAINGLGANASESFTVTVTDSATPALSSNGTLLISITGVNDAPTVTSIADQNIQEDTATVAIGFGVADVETPAGKLTVSAVSSNPNVLAAGGITLGSGVSAQGLIGRWSFDSAEDLGKNSVTGVALNKSGDPAWTVNGKIGGALELNGSSWLAASSGTIDNLPIGSSSYSVSLWFKARTFGSKGFVGWGSYGDVNEVNAFRLDGDTRIVNYWWGNDLSAPTGSPLIPNVWYHAVATYDGAQRSIYLNGQKIASTTGSGVNVQPLNFGIGKTVGNEYFDGWIDEVAIYSRSLSESEIGQLAQGANADRMITMTPVANASGTSTVTVTVTDEANATTTTSFTLTVAAVNDAPTLTAISIDGAEDTTVAFTAAKFTAAYSDVEQTALASITVVSLPATGTLKLSGNAVTAGQVITAQNLGNLTYVPAANENGAKTFTVTASDGVASSQNATVTINLAAANDAPNLASISVNGTEDKSVVFTASNFTGAYSDVEQTALASITVVSLPATGTLKLSGNAVTAGQVITAQNLANLTYVPAANENGAKTFKVSASDGLLSSPEAKVTINLAVANDAPIASGEATLAPINEDAGLASSGQRVGDLFAANFSDSTDGGQSTLAGVGVSSHVPDSSRGAWQYSTDGQNWVALASASLSSTITLKSSDRVRFVPAGDYNGAATALEVLLIESGGDAITSGASINLSGIGSQVLLKPSAVVGWSTIYSSSFSADRVLDNQTGTVSQDIFAQNYWLGADRAATAGLIIDLGAPTSLSQVELYNTSNANYNDRGTIKFRIELAAAITGNSPTSYALVNPVNAASGTLSPAAVGAAPTAQLFSLNTSGIQPRYLRFVVESSKNNNPGLNEIRIFSVTGSNGGSTVYSQAAVPLKHTVNPVNDAPVLTSVNSLTGATEDTDFTISYQALAAAADESDVDSGNLQFRIESISSGTLTLSGVPVTAGSTVLAAGQSLVWRPALDANGVLEAFKVKAWDGELASAAAVPVKVSVAAVADPVTIEGLVGVSRVYDGTRVATVTGVPVLKGVASGADVKLSGTPVFTFAQAAVSDAPVLIAMSGYSLTGAQAADYVLTLPTLSAKITPKSVTLTVSAAARAYQAVNPAFGFESFSSQLAAGDTTAEVIGGNGAANDLVYRLAVTKAASPVGVYRSEIGVDPASIDGSKVANYAVTVVAGDLTITPAALTITLDAGSLAQSFSGSPRSVSWTTQPAGVAVKVTYNGSANPPVVAGTYAVLAQSDDANYAGQASGVLLIRSTLEALKSEAFLIGIGLNPVSGGEGRYLLEGSLGQAFAGSVPVVLGFQVESGFWFAGRLAEALSPVGVQVPSVQVAAQGIAVLRSTTVATDTSRTLATQEPQMASGIRLPEARLSVLPAADATRVRIVISGLPGANWKVQHLDGLHSGQWQDSGLLRLNPEGVGVIETGSGDESAMRFYRLVQP